MKKVITGIKMRKCFADTLRRRMATNGKIWIVTADLGYKMWDEIKINYPDRFINVGAAEQVMVGVGVGLALEGKIPFVYSITPFLLYRPFETIRNYINQEKIPVKLVGSGRNQDYIHDGFSHWAEEDKEIMKIFKNIKARWPNTNAEIPALVDEMLKDKSPYYVNLRK
jgi:transketolase